MLHWIVHYHLDTPSINRSLWAPPYLEILWHWSASIYRRWAGHSVNAVIAVWPWIYRWSRSLLRPVFGNLYLLHLIR